MADGAPASSILHCRRRGKACHAGGGTARHAAATAQPANSRAGAGARCSIVSPQAARRRADRRRLGAARRCSRDSGPDRSCVRHDQAYCARRAGADFRGVHELGPLHPFVPRIIRAYRETFPLVSLTLEESGTTDLIDYLRDERIDAAFIRTTIPNQEGLVVDLLLQEAMVLALPRAHVLA